MTPLSSAVLTALTAAIALAPGLTHAATPAGVAPSAAAPPSVTVRYGDLDLGTDQGTAALYARLVSAAHQVCPLADIRDLGGLAAARACRQQAVANAVRDLGSPRLAAVYAARIRHG